MMTEVDIIVAEIIKIITTPPFKDVLIGAAGSASWDGVKKIISRLTKNSEEAIIWKIFTGTMFKFYSRLNFEYNEEIVAKCMIEELVKEGDKLTPVKFQQCLEKALTDDGEFVEKVSDETFKLWVTIFAEECAQHSELMEKFKIKKEIADSFFTERGRLYQRIYTKIQIHIGNENHSAQLFRSIVENVNNVFQDSWKDSLRDLLSKLPPLDEADRQKADSLMDLIYADEECEIVLHAFMELYSLHEKKHINKRIGTEVNDMIRHPHFNKVWIVVGETGAGKTYCINEFVSFLLEGGNAFNGGILPCLIDISKLNYDKTFDQLLTDQYNDFFRTNISTIENVAHFINLNFSQKLH